MIFYYKGGILYREIHRNFKTIIVILIGATVLRSYPLESNDDYESVYEQGFSKMQMLEKIDDYISKDLSNKIKGIQQEINEIKQEDTSSKIANIIQKLEKMDKRLAVIEELKLNDRLEKISELSNDDFKKVKEAHEEIKNKTIPELEKKMEQMKESIKNLDTIFKSIDGVNKKIKEI